MCGEQADIGDAADIDDGAAFQAEQAALEERRKRRTLTAGGDVAAAEIGDGVDTAQFGEAGGVLQLDGVRWIVIGFMAQGLAVGTAGGDGVSIQASFPEQGSDGGGTGGGMFPGGDSSAV